MGRGYLLRSLQLVYLRRLPQLNLPLALRRRLGLRLCPLKAQS
jgi:hypothetical protein